MFETVRDGDHLGVEEIDTAEDMCRGPEPRLFHRIQFLNTAIRLVRKDSHVREP
ncbi:hypothetical protein OG429_36200 [Streptomyces sp. NBC_00190]|uniref:hypothetical protein n=1 Tax=unclassified Streptomyces TaxID=2593676 RepID=UPI002E295375|nr:hypothetical protein [Streptomyces sp. NBC_00190]WSZ44234.1 hypothetical protein OG239_38665 [Streptomyces sp. NBC_00868]